MSEVAAVVLAAGQGSRYGPEPKLLAPFAGKPLVRHVAEAAVASVAEPVIVVTGHRAGEIEAAVHDLPVRTVRNDAFSDGLSSSLKAGFAALPAKAQAVVVLLGDMPLISVGLIDDLIAGWERHGRPIAVIPTFAGRRGNPVLMSREIEDEIRSLQGDAGAGSLLRRHPGAVEWPTSNAATVRDVDTADELRALKG
jgi:molybdenum cofactor cytidylyltransferase